LDSQGLLLSVVNKLGLLGATFLHPENVFFPINSWIINKVIFSCTNNPYDHFFYDTNYYPIELGVYIQNNEEVQMVGLCSCPISTVRNKSNFW